MRPVADTTEEGSDNLLVRECSSEARAELVRRGRLQAYQAGDILCKEGDASGVALLPMQGKLQLSKTAPNGRRQVFCYLDPATCPSVCLLMMSERSLVDVSAVEPGMVMVLPRQDLADLAMTDRTLGETTWSAMVQCMSHFVGMVENLSFHKVAERVVSALLEGARNDGGTVRRTQAELAAEVGTTREVVARCLSELQATGAIKLGRGRITILNRDLLQRAF